MRFNKFEQKSSQNLRSILHCEKLELTNQKQKMFI